MLLLDVDITPAKPPNATLPAIDYAAVCAQLRDFAASKQHYLIEDFARETAALIMENYAAATVTVVCRKISPFADLAAAGVEITLPAVSN